MPTNEVYDQARAEKCIAGLERLKHYVTRKQRANIDEAITFLEKTIVALDVLERKPGAVLKAWEEGARVKKARGEHDGEHPG